MSLFDRSPTPAPVVNVTVPPSPTADLWHRPFLRGGLYAWAFLGLVGALIVLGRVAAAVSIVVIPLVLALFPAAVLAPMVARMTRRGVPAGIAAALAILTTFGILVGIGFAVAPSVSEQFEGLGEQFTAGFDQIEQFLASGPFGLDPIRMEDLVARGREYLSKSASNLGSGVVGAVTLVTETVAGLFFGLFALFMYLKDGPKMARWLRTLFPEPMQDDAAQVGVLAWQTIGAYVRGQLIIAVVDAVLIGIGIVVLGVPLALPLILLVFFGGLFPIVGAILAGFVAVLVALATTGLTTALILLAVIVVVQQVEGDVLAPIVLGKATELHPLVSLAALTAGAVLLGVLGAFLAIPVTASLTRAFAYLRRQRRERAAALAT